MQSSQRQPSSLWHSLLLGLATHHIAHPHSTATPTTAATAPPLPTSRPRSLATIASTGKGKKASAASLLASVEEYESEYEPKHKEVRETFTPKYSTTQGRCCIHKASPAPEPDTVCCCYCSTPACLMHTVQAQAQEGVQGRGV